MYDPLSGTDTPFVLYVTVSFVDSHHSAIFSGATTIHDFNFNISKLLLISISAAPSRQIE